MARISQRISTLIILIASALLTSGCAVVLPRDGSSGPDLDKVRVGSSQADVESVLGAPRDEDRVASPHGILKKATYIYYIRGEKVSDDNRAERFMKKFTDFEERGADVFYNRQGRVIRVIKH